MIRQANQSDIASVTQIYERIHNEEENGNLIIGWVRGIYPTEKTAQTAFENGELYVFDEGKILAAAIINHKQLEEYYACDWKFKAEDNEVLVLHTLVVDPECICKGVGNKFISYYEDKARRTNCKVVRIDTNELNVNARKLYKKLGYIESGKVHCSFNEIRGIDLMLLEKQL